MTTRRLILLAAALALAVQAVRVFAGPNEHVVRPGKVYRSSQPSGERLTRLIAERGIRTVVNLRGTGQQVHHPKNAWYLAEAEAAHAAGVSQEDITLSAFLLPPPAELKRLLEVLDRSEPPILIHCKQGADRTGLASAVVVLLDPAGTLAEARRELWPLYGHMPVGRTVAMDDFFDRYEAWLTSRGSGHTPGLFRVWVANDYTPGPACSRLEWLDPVPVRLKPGQPLALRLKATNRSGEAWELKPGNQAGIHVLYKVAADPATEAYRGQAGLFTATVAPGDSVTLTLTVPPLAPGRYNLVAELMDARGCGVPVRASSFVKFGDEPILAELTVAE